MKPVRITYDPEGDVLYLTFGQPVASTGYQLSDQLLLRVDSQTQEANGLTIFNYSYHSTAGGELPIPGIDEHPGNKVLLLNILNSVPVNQFIHLVTNKDGVKATLLSPTLQQAVGG
jgi:uncharacterized protein YuzE